MTTASLTFGIRKLARFDYENKPEVWYSGEESPINESVMIGNGMVKGWEYVLEYSDISANLENRSQNKNICYDIYILSLSLK